MTPSPEFAEETQGEVSLSWFCSLCRSHRATFKRLEGTHTRLHICHPQSPGDQVHPFLHHTLLYEMRGVAMTSSPEM